MNLYLRWDHVLISCMLCSCGVIPKLSPISFFMTGLFLLINNDAACHLLNIDIIIAKNFVIFLFLLFTLLKGGLKLFDLIILLKVFLDETYS